MRAPISVIIPTLNAQDSLPSLLSSLYEGVAAGLICEVIVSDGGSLDETCKIANQSGTAIIKGLASRGGQVTRACLEARGDWLLILHADCILPKGWSDVVRSCLVNDQKAFFFKLGFNSTHLMARITEGWANLRSMLFRLPYGDQGLLIAQKQLTSIGGYPDQPLMEDVEIALKLKRQMRMLPVTILTSAAAYEENGWILRGTRNLIHLFRYLTGVSPEDLKKSYYNQT